ncbi:MAG TPA: SelB C-terminal domain-containing protein [Isosphaeraceae bacterium]|nr:SelB C-terminal domain-containing protein [Isosphaeraceae bacterium]
MSGLRDLVLGTAGHIDHGKAESSRALMGVDTGRLPAEGRRGITIDLGIAAPVVGDFLPSWRPRPARAAVVPERLADGSPITMAELRDLLGTTRRSAVPVGEYLDRIGLTRREGETRRLGESRTAPAPTIEINDRGFHQFPVVVGPSGWPGSRPHPQPPSPDRDVVPPPILSLKLLNSDLIIINIR